MWPCWKGAWTQMNRTEENRKGKRKRTGEEWTRWAVPSPDHDMIPTLRAGVFYGSPSRFPVPFLATPQQRSLQRSKYDTYGGKRSKYDTYGGKTATLQYGQLPDRDTKLKVQYEKEQTQVSKRTLLLCVLILLKNKILRCSCEVIVHQHRYEHQRPYSSSIPSYHSKQRNIASHPSYDMLYPALVLFAAWLYTAWSCGWRAHTAVLTWTRSSA